MRLTNIHVEHYGPLSRFSHECEDNLEVFYGPNESGKTLLLEAVLKFLTPDIESALPSVTRVDHSPTGHVIVEVGGNEEKLGDGTVIEDFIDLTPTDLRNIFVIRDSDLELNDQHDFYDSITQRIGDLHTTEIDAIQDRLQTVGRLTDGRALSSARPNDNADEVRKTARNLAEEIDEYIDEAEDRDIDELEREFIALKSELKQCEDTLATQEAAETLATHETLSARLETYREATQRLDDDISRETLEQLSQLDRDIREADDTIEELGEKRASLREERTQFEAELEEVEAAQVPLEGRRQDIDELERSLAAFRESSAASLGAPRGMRFAKYVALGGIGLGGIGAILGSTVAGVLLAVIGGIAGIWYGLQHRSVTNAEQERKAVLETAQDAGMDASELDEIGPTIRGFRDELESLQARRDELVRKISVKEELIDEREGTLETTRKERRENREKKRQLLQKADVVDIDEYRGNVERYEELQRDRDRAAQSLSDALGQPDGESTDSAANIDYWEAELDTMVSDIDDDISTEEHDQAQLDELREEYDQLQDRHGELKEQLEAHERRLRDFDEKIQSISAQPFLDEEISLSVRSIEGLNDISPDLERLAERISRDADIAREALDIFDGIQATEEQKITDLFGDDSKATEVFRSITNGRYSGVTYDAEEKVLQVHRDSEEVYTPEQLSHGTKEQLYLSARIGLADQLLTAEPGFFLMDDAFLPADGTRLREGFEVLQELAESGWQILYFTAKDEVGRDVVADHEFRCRTLESLS